MVFMGSEPLTPKTTQWYESNHCRLVINLLRLTKMSSFSKNAACSVSAYVVQSQILQIFGVRTWGGRLSAHKVPALIRLPCRRLLLAKGTGPSSKPALLPRCFQNEEINVWEYYYINCSKLLLPLLLNYNYIISIICANKFIVSKFSDWGVRMSYLNSVINCGI